MAGSCWLAGSLVLDVLGRQDTKRHRAASRKIYLQLNTWIRWLYRLQLQLRGNRPNESEENVFYPQTLQEVWHSQALIRKLSRRSSTSTGFKSTPPTQGHLFSLSLLFQGKNSCPASVVL